VPRLDADFLRTAIPAAAARQDAPPLRQHRFRFQRNVSGAGRQPSNSVVTCRRIAKSSRNLSRSSRRIANVVSPRSRFPSHALGNPRVWSPRSRSRIFAAERSTSARRYRCFSTKALRPSVPFRRGRLKRIQDHHPRSSARFHVPPPASDLPRGPRRRAAHRALFGCRRLHTSAQHSGQPVKSETSRTGIPASRRSLAVPPVGRISISAWPAASANSTIRFVKHADERALHRHGFLHNGKSTTV